VVGSLLTIACCYWQDFPEGEPTLGAEYVRRLRNGVSRNLPLPYRFVCFADRELYIDGIEVRKLTSRHWKRNLPKTFVYSPDAGLEGRVLLFDLDNVITGDLSDMAAYDGPLCVRGRFQNTKPRLPDGDMISFEAGSDMARHLWGKANDGEVIRHSKEGREREFIAWAAPQADHWQDVCPGQVVSYRLQCKGRLPKGARVVSCHGRPRPHEIKEAFIAENWR